MSGTPIRDGRLGARVAVGLVELATPKRFLTSSTVLASAPRDESPAASTISHGMRSGVGRRPTTPQHDAGIRTDPPMSSPNATVAIPAATAAALPPLDPPGVTPGRPGLGVGGRGRRGGGGAGVGREGEGREGAGCGLGGCVHVDVRMNARVVPLDGGEVSAHHRLGIQVAGADAPGDLGRRQPGQRIPDFRSHRSRVGEAAFPFHPSPSARFRITWNTNACRSLRTTTRVGSGLVRNASVWKTATWTSVQAAMIAAAPKAVGDGMVRRRAWNVAAKMTRSITPRPSATLSISRPVHLPPAEEGDEPRQPQRYSAASRPVAGSQRTNEFTGRSLTGVVYLTFGWFFAAAGRRCSTHWRRALRFNAPTTRSRSLPPSIKTSVGIPRTPNLSCRPRATSVLTLTTFI